VAFKELRRLTRVIYEDMLIGLQDPHGGSHLLPAGVSKGLGWLQGSPKPSSSPAQGSPAHPAAVAAGVSGAASKQQSQQLWQPFVPQSPSSGSTGFAAKPSPQAAAAAASGSPMHSTAPPAAMPAGSIGSYTSRMQGPFSSSSSSKQSMSPQVDRFLSAGTKQQTPPLADSAVVHGEAVPATAADAVTAPLGLRQPQAVVKSAAADEAASSNGLVEAAQPSSGSTQKLMDATETAGTAGLEASESNLSSGTATDGAASSLTSSTVRGQEHRHESTDATAADAAAAVLSSSGDAAAGTSTSSGAASISAGPAAAAAANAPAAASDHPVASGSGAPSAESSQDGSAGREEQVHASAAAPAGLASTAAAAGGPGKEAQLTRLVETLRKRLEVVRGENQQLEDMLHEAEQRSSAEQATIAKLTAELTVVQREQEGLVSSAAANAAAQDAHIGRLQAELEASSRQVAALQAELHAAQEQHAQALSSKDDMEGGALEGTPHLLSGHCCILQALLQHVPRQLTHHSYLWHGVACFICSFPCA